MLSTKQAQLAVGILVPLLIAALSFSVLSVRLPQSAPIQSTLEQLEESSDTVLKFSAATLGVSLALSALPDDFASPIAEGLTDMNQYFVIILAALFVEKLLVRQGVQLVFAALIPAACVLYLLGTTLLKTSAVRTLALRLGAMGLALVLVVPCSTHFVRWAAADLTEYVESTISDTNAGGDKLNEAMNGGSDATIFDRLSALFETAISGISELMEHFKATTRRCVTSVAILLVTNCATPILTFLLLRWITAELFRLSIPLPSPRRRREEEKGAVHEVQ